MPSKSGEVEHTGMANMRTHTEIYECTTFVDGCLRIRDALLEKAHFKIVVAKHLE